ncbi:ABC transporter substrate-binding protein [Mycolicibacterium bacteremicum]|uniref:ABC transporter substrate-binding protein n=1 Tax=Mycolicibacterium bacteremicum TaxID=564198 RepID=UPI0026EA4135|nr:ABC transporter substrate-binding protein [Mycolicibacterium bacteremicum]
MKIASLLVAAALLLTACGGGGSENAAPEGPVDLSTVTLKVGDQRAISIEVLMKASGQLADAPYKVEFSTFTAGPPLVEAASAGGIHLAQVGNTPGVFGAAAGADIKFVGALEATGKGDAILVAKESPVAGVADLKGKKVAVTKGSSANANLLLHLKKAGLGLSDIEPVYVAPADGYAALTRGEVDAWAVWDPYTAIAEQEVGARIIAAADTAGNGYNFWVASAGALDDPAVSEAIADFLDRYAVATKWSADNLDKWSADYAKLTEISPEASKITWTRSIKHPVPLTDDVVASEQEIADAFTEAKEFPAAVEIADFVDDRFQGEGS